MMPELESKLLEETLKKALDVPELPKGLVKELSTALSEPTEKYEACLKKTVEFINQNQTDLRQTMDKGLNNLETNISTLRENVAASTKQFQLTAGKELLQRYPQLNEPAPPPGSSAAA